MVLFLYFLFYFSPISSLSLSFSLAFCNLCGSLLIGGGRVERKCWVNFQCRGVLLVWMIVGQGPIALVVGAGWGCLDIFSLICLFCFLSPSLWETARYRLKYCLKGPLNPKQPTNTLDIFSVTPHFLGFWAKYVFFKYL